MTVEAFVGSLSASEKLLVMELIWRELSVSGEMNVVPDWHDRLVHQRLDNPSPGESLELREAFAEIQGWLNASKTSS